MEFNFDVHKILMAFSSGVTTNDIFVISGENLRARQVDRKQSA